MYPDVCFDASACYIWKVKTMVVLFFLLTVLCQQIAQTLLLTYYYTHKEYITQNYCEYRENTTLHCQGKCYLRKQLTKQEKKSGIIVQFLKNYKVNFFQHHPGIYVCERFFTTITLLFFPFRENYHYLPADLIFQPPG